MVSVFHFRRKCCPGCQHHSARALPKLSDGQGAGCPAGLLQYAADHGLWQPSQGLELGLRFSPACLATASVLVHYCPASPRRLSSRFTDAPLMTPTTGP